MVKKALKRTWLFLVAMPYEPQAILCNEAFKGTEVPTRGTSRPGLAKSNERTCRSRVRGQGATGFHIRSLDEWQQGNVQR